jgi:hypothetical protein
VTAVPVNVPDQSKKRAAYRLADEQSHFRGSSGALSVRLGTGSFSLKRGVMFW